jgi:hypothetical protein
MAVAMGSSSRGIRPLRSPSPKRPSARPLPPDPGRPRRQNALAAVNGLGFGPTEPPVGIPFRPRGFSPPRRIAPRGGCEFVAPRCRPWGSPRFPSRAPGPPRGFGLASGRFPRCGSHPSKSSPRQQPRRITAALAVLPLPFGGGCGTSRDARCRTPQPAPPRRSSRLHGLAPLTSPLQPDTVSSVALPVPSMGFVPLQGPNTLRSNPDEPGSAPVPASRRRRILGAHRRGESRPLRPRWHPSRSSPPCRCVARGEPRPGPDGAALQKSVRRVSSWSAIRAAVIAADRRGGRWR